MNLDSVKGAPPPAAADTIQADATLTEKDDDDFDPANFDPADFEDGEDGGAELGGVQVRRQSFPILKLPPQHHLRGS